MDKLAILARAFDTKGYPDDKNPDHWRTINGAPAHLDANGNIDGGAGGKFTGNQWNSKQHPHKPESYEKKVTKEELSKAWKKVSAAKLNIVHYGATPKYKQKLEASVKELEELHKKSDASLQTSFNPKMKDIWEYMKLMFGPKDPQAGTAKGKLPSNKHPMITTSSVLGKSIAICGPEHLGHINSMIHSAPVDYQKAWLKVADKLRLANGKFVYTSTKGAHYIKGFGVCIDMKDAAKGNKSGKYPYETFFHEFGHNMDYELGYKKYNKPTFFSVAYKNGLFEKTIRNEVRKHVERHADEVRKAHPSWKHNDPRIEKAAYTRLSHEIATLRSSNKYLVAGIEDIFSGGTENKVNTKWKHNTDYWVKDHTLIAIEAFAEMTESLTSSPERAKIYEEWFPESYKLFKEMLKEAGK